MDDTIISNFVSELMFTEIAPAIPYDVDQKQAVDFGNSVLERFRNPFIQHQWINITMNYTLKMKGRAVPLFVKYYERFNTVPEYFATCFAAYLLFMKPVKIENGKYYGLSNGKEYIINDTSAALFSELWKSNDVQALVNNVLADTSLWDTDLTQLTGFEQEVVDRLKMMMENGIFLTLQTKKELV